MKTLYAPSTDGRRIAYEQCGTGPAIVLVHGGGGTRDEWRAAGYVDRLRGGFTIIAFDLRGHGESSLPTEATAYSTATMGDDILAVADACGVERFAIWGVSFGGNVSRYLAARSQRVSKLVLLGSPLGPGASGQRRTQALDFCAHWPPILQGLRDGTLDSGDLSPEDRDSLHRLNIPAMLGWVQAMLDWPVVGPTDLLCPTLWLVGSEDDHAMASVREFEDSLPGSGVQLHVVQGLDHEQIFDEIETVLPIMVAFTKS